MTHTRIDLLQEALTLAMQVIESYQLDIRHAQETIGVDLLAKGFCQGVVYDNALCKLAGMRMAAALVDDDEVVDNDPTTVCTASMHTWASVPDGQGGFRVVEVKTKV